MTHKTIPSQFQLSGKQLSVLATFKEFVAGRNAEYREHEYDNVNWKKPILVKGHAGTGKSYVMEARISYCLQNNLIVHIATPTGTLASIYGGMYGDTLTTDTVHATFNIPHSVDNKATINWELGFHDVIFIDEISQLSIHVYRHIMTTLNGQLHRLQDNRVICEHDVTDADIVAAATAHPNALFLTVSNAATNFINDTLIQAQRSHPIITHIITSKDMQTCPVFHT